MRAALWRGWIGGSLLWALIALPAHAQQPLRAGLGVADLPTPLDAPMGGYGGLRDRRATSVHDPPQARALLLEGSGLRVAWVSLDIVIVRPELRASLAQRVEALGLDGLLLAATHTHSGPGGYIEGFLAERITSGSFDPRAREGLLAAAVDALDQARSDLHAVRVRTGEGGADLAENRRDPDGSRETALPVLELEALEASTPPIVVFAYGAHPTLWSPRNRAYSADYVGAARAWLDQRGVRSLFLGGPMGDQGPRSGSGPLGSWSLDQEERQVEEMGQGLGEATEATLAALRLGESELAVVEREVDLPELRLRRPCALWLVSPLIQGAVRELLSPRVRFQVYAVGPARVVGIPAEPSSDLGRAIRERIAERFPGSIPFVVAHANDWAGYAVTESAYARGGYEACLSFRGPGFGAWLVQAADDALEGLNERMQTP